MFIALVEGKNIKKKHLSRKLHILISLLDYLLFTNL